MTKHLFGADTTARLFLIQKNNLVFNDMQIIGFVRNSFGKKLENFG